MIRLNQNFVVMMSTLIWLIISCVLAGYLQAIKSGNLTEDCYIHAKFGNCLLTKYDKLDPPSRQMSIQVSILVVQIFEVSDSFGTVDFWSWLTFEWEDNSVFMSDNLVDNKWYQLNQAWQTSIWVPDIFIRELRSIQFLAFDKPYKGEC